jgi:hypothetical protein
MRMRERERRRGGEEKNSLLMAKEKKMHRATTRRKRLSQNPTKGFFFPTREIRWRHQINKYFRMSLRNSISSQSSFLLLLRIPRQLPFTLPTSPPEGEKKVRGPRRHDWRQRRPKPSPCFAPYLRVMRTSHHKRKRGGDGEEEEEIRYIPRGGFVFFCSR